MPATAKVPSNPIDLAAIERVALANVDDEVLGPTALAYLRRTAMAGLLEFVYGELDPSDSARCSSVRSAIKRLYDDHIRWVLDERAKSGAAQAYFRSLRDSGKANTRVSIYPADVVSANLSELFLHRILPYGRPERIALEAVLETGEEILEVGEDRIITSKREIDRYGLRQLRCKECGDHHPAGFPTRIAIETAARKAMPNPDSYSWENSDSRSA
jgi:hypothetical protein